MLFTEKERDRWKFDTEWIIHHAGDQPPLRLEPHEQKASSETKVHVDLTGIDFDTLSDYGGWTGWRSKKLSLRVEMVPSGTSVEFRFLHKGRKIGSQMVHPILN